MKQKTKVSTTAYPKSDDKQRKNEKMMQRAPEMNLIVHANGNGIETEWETSFVWWERYWSAGEKVDQNSRAFISSKKQVRGSTRTEIVTFAAKKSPHGK
jgi:hypothetical protein